MKWVNLLRRWTMKSIHAAILGAALTGTASLAFAQVPAAPAVQTPRHYSKSLTFDLPVVMDQADRVNLSEFRLYVRTPTSGWKLQDAGPQNMTRFCCRVTQDGEYWYLLTTVDRGGKQSPSDVNMEPPVMRVIVDTTAPVIQVHPWTSPDNDLCVRCVMQDANPDAGGLRAVCRTDSGDLPLEPVSSQPGAFRLKGGDMMRFPVVLTARDLAGNVATKEINVREFLGAALAPAAKTPNTIAQIGGLPDAKTLVPPPRNDLPPPRVDRVEEPGKVLTFPPAPPPIPPMAGALDPTQKIAPPLLDTLNPGGVPHQLINTTRAKIDFRIDQVGPSGVGKVEIYMTPDKGHSWHRLAEHTQKSPPAEINLPGDGVFGIRIVASNGNGFGGRAPVRGDSPHYVVEVDTTAPFVQLRSAELMAGAGHVELRWNATDNNLGATPVSLYYRTKTDGPWQDIAKNVKNDGMYRWTFPRDAGGQFFFKIEVTDKAGNLAQEVSRQPIVIDMSEPRITVVGVTGAAISPLRPVGGGQ
jgi:hypothetical protein